MQKDFEKFYPIDVENCLMDKKIQFQTSDYMPSYHRIQPYMPKGLPFIAPIEHTGWRDEALACQYTCALTANLNPTPGVRISGPDAARFMMDATVNNIERFPVGSSKHGIMCAENGDMAAGGVILRSGEDIWNC